MKKPRSSQTLIDKELRRQRDTCVKQGDEDAAFDEYAAYIGKLNEDLSAKCAVGDFANAKMSSTNTRILGRYHATCGSFVVNGQQDAAGWKQLDLGAKYAYWFVKMSLGARLRALRTCEHALRLMTEVDILTSLLCYSYVLDLADWFEELRSFWGLVASIPGVTMYESISGGEVSKWRNVEPDGFVRSDGHFDRFVTHLFGGPRFGPPFELYDEVERLTLGPYQEIVDCWEDEGERFADALRNIADYHARNIDNSHNLDLLLPFSHPLISLAPWEIGAIYKLRAEAGLQTPEIDHPLMKLPAAAFEPRTVEPVDDPIFAQLDALYAKNCRIEDYL
ncbi:MAG: hypothetical protein KF688_03810 [Pirellulales bacterium]|nr:hypothetical protein [Pirellulales bacterium]